ncbi:hypothetical protein QYE76_066703 [Lolium multiflorum]|uniref:CCHC-type domain-containing protein n=1 Tax=Lolium multiflorum TaxID=4521 RepID=A0AAD8SCT5_LOLMU|nr:hypothetical protein QYE76_066703 [Lolium multiflorum]
MQACLGEQIGRNIEVYIDDIVVKTKHTATLIDDLRETFDNLDKYKIKLNLKKCFFGVPGGQVLGYFISARGIEANPLKIKAILDMEPPKNLHQVQQLAGRLAALSRFIAKLGEKALPFYNLMKKSEKFEWTVEAQESFDNLKKILSTSPILVTPRERETLLMYIAATAQVFSSVLVVEREEAGKVHGVQRPVYYLSEVLTPASRGTPIIEAAYAVWRSARKLRHYFTEHPIVVLPQSFRNINDDDGTPRIQAVHLTPSTIASSRSSATVIKWSGDEPRDGEVLRNTERLVTQHNLWAQRQEFKEQLTLFETRIDEQYEEVAHNFGQVNQDMNLLREATDNLHDQVKANDANMERRMDSLERAINNLGRMEIIIDLVARMFVKMTLAQTQGAESSIAMLVLMNVRNKNKLFTKIVIKRLAMPTMGMTTKPTTTSSTTWNRHLIVKPMLMLKTNVIKIHQGVTSETILAMTKGAENNHNMIKMRGTSLGNANNLVKIRNNIINVIQVKLVFNSTANPMLWLAVEDLLYHPKPQEMKGEDDAEAYLSWALKVDKIFRIHNYSGAKKVAMASLEFEEYANTWWEQVVTQREEKGQPPIDTWEDMKEEMQARFVPTHYKTDLFNKLQKLKQGTKTVEEFFKEMELTMMRANIQESENQTIARFFNGLNYPIKRIVEFQQYSNMVELVHQASKAERQVNEDIKYSKSKQYFASKLATTTPTTSVKPTASSTPSKQPTIQSRMKQTVSSTASSKASTGSSNVTCFKCGTQGHKSFECKNTKVMITMENGDIETLSEGEYEALVQAAVANEEECNIFQTRAGIGGKSIKVIIDGGSCHNLASTELCEKLNLTLRKHPHPYHVQWLSDKGNVKIQHTVTVNFKIGPYEDTVECDVVPMTVCHMLLGRPWQFDKKAIHDGYSNAYTFKVKDKKFELRPMTPSQIIADNAKALARAQHHTHHSELRGEGATHQKESERHHPHMSERKSVLLATKSESSKTSSPTNYLMDYHRRGIEHRIDLIPGAPLPNQRDTAPTPKTQRRFNAKYKTSSPKGTFEKALALVPFP